MTDFYAYILNTYNTFEHDESDLVQFEFDSVQTTDPFENEKYLVVFIGQIMNRVALKSELENSGCIFKAGCDAELIVNLYDLKKESMLTDLRGMFSFFIWDKEASELFGARDPFGIKPFYYINNESGFYFSSSMGNLVETEYTREVNSEALHHYFSFQYVPESFTIHNGIHKLEAGHFIKKKSGEPLQTESYWQMAFQPKIQPLEEKLQKIQTALRNSVHLHMQSDVPVGAFLSGGVDSSAIVALAKEVNPDIKTFTVGFELGGYNEINVAKRTAEQLGVENVHYVISPEEFLAELPHVIKHFSEPLADPISVPLYIASREARKKVDIILSGEGADELFGGYMIYREPIDLRIFKFVPNWLQNILYSLATRLPEGMYGKSFLARGTVSLEERYIGNAKIFNDVEKSDLLKKYDPNFTYMDITSSLYDEIPHYPDVHKMQYIDLHTWIRGDILVNADRMTSAHSLEMRVPFLDQDVYQVASELTPTETITNRTTKYALREALRGIVPDTVLYNKKLGFPVPIRHWLKNEWYDWAKKVIEHSPVDHLICQSFALNLLEKHKHGKVDYSRKLWTILVFIIWYEGAFRNESFIS